MFNYLALLGWSSPEGLDVFSRQYAIDHFSFDRVNPAGAMFDRQKFEWVNGQYIHAMSAAELAKFVRPFFDVPWLEEGIDIVKTSIHRLTELPAALQFVLEYTPPTSVEMPFAEKLAEDLRTNGAPTDEASYKAMVERLKTSTGLKGKGLFMPLRLAITGLEHGPELVRSIPLIEHASKADERVLSPLARVERILASESPLPAERGEGQGEG
jgi:nondiscriminating glutamyl-tRNA synthetase